MRPLVLALIFLLTGCTSFSAKTMKLYPGQPEQDVVSLLGAPERTEHAGPGSKRLVYSPDYDGYHFFYYVDVVEGKANSFGVDQQSEERARAAQNDYARRMQAVGQAMQNMSNQMRATSSQCDSLSIAPIADPGCRSVCINGQWASVCGQ